MVQTHAVFEIDPAQYRKDWTQIGCFGVLSLVFGGLAMICAVGMTDNGIWVLGLFTAIFLLPALGLPVALFTMNRRQRISIEGDKIFITGTGVTGRANIEIAPEHIERIACGAYGGAPGDDVGEMFHTLSIFVSERPERIILANYVHPDDKKKICRALSQFFQENGITLPAYCD